MISEDNSSKGLFSKILDMSIPGQKNYKKALKQIEEQYQMIFEYAGTGIVIINKDMEIVAANRKAEEISGYSKEEVINHFTWQHFLQLDEERQRILGYAKTRMEQGEHAAPFQYECKMVHKDGTPRDLLVNISPIPGTMNIHCSFIDISELHQAYRLLKESEHRFKETVEFLPAVYAEFDNHMNFIYINKVGYDTFHCTEEQIRNREITFIDFFDKEAGEQERVQEVLMRRRSDNYSLPEEYKLKDLKGNVKYFLVISSFIHTEGEITGMRTCLIEITERKKVEQELKKSESQLQAMFDSSPIGISLLNKQGETVRSNSAFRQLFSLEKNHIPISIFKALNLKGSFEGLKEIEPEQGLRIVIEEDNVNFISVDNLHLSWRLSRIPNTSEENYLCQVIDVTDERNAQERELSRAKQEVSKLKQALSEKSSLHSMVGESPEMQELFKMLPEVAAMPITLLVTGESGTGKELIAKTVHELSPRKDGPFVAINCGALPDNLLEAELFGHKAGAFTDAKKDRKGKFMAAHGGTIFLDEIGEISHTMQVKLLRVLQEREVEPLGSDKSYPVDVRVISATNRDLAEEVQKGNFRQDLYYRIKVVSLQLPPLRNRKRDIPVLSEYFLEELNKRYGKRITSLSHSATDKLLAYSFPGNIRELHNIIEHAYLFCNGSKIDTKHLPNEVVLNPNAISDGSIFERITSLDQLEKEYIEFLLEKFNGSRKQTAEYLRIHKATLFRKMKRYGLMDSPTEEL